MSNTKKIKVKKKKEEEVIDPFTQTIRESLVKVGKKADPYQEKLLVQLLKSFLVGGIATIVDIILFCILSIFISPLLSNSISMILTILLGFFVGLKYIYDKKNRKIMIREYFILNGISFLVSEGIIYGFVSIKSWNAILVKILAVVVVLILKLLIKRFILSNQKISKK